MAVLSPYSLATFKAYLHTVLGNVATNLGWTVNAGNYDEIVNDALLALNTDDIATLTTNNQLKQLRAAGRVSLWRMVASTLASDYNFSADGGSYSREQAHTQALRMLQQAETDAAALGVLEGYEVTTAGATYGRDPYKDYDTPYADFIDTI